MAWQTYICLPAVALLLTQCLETSADAATFLDITAIGWVSYCPGMRISGIALRARHGLWITKFLTGLGPLVYGV